MLTFCKVHSVMSRYCRSKKDEAISLNAMEGNVTISHTSGLEVLFSPSGEVTLTVRATLANRLCAPCGNFNGDAQDAPMLRCGPTSWPTSYCPFT